MPNLLIKKLKTLVAPSRPENRLVREPHKANIKKRHWLLGGIVILIGSWITHTTTATVYDQQIGSIESIASDSLSMGEAVHSVDLKAQLASSSITAIPATVPEILDIEPALTFSNYTIKRGDNLAFIFKKLGFNQSLPYWISKDKIGKQLISLSVDRELTFGVNSNNKLSQISYSLDPLHNLSFDIDGTLISNAQVANVAYQVKQRSVTGEITSSLYETAQASGLSNNLIMEMVRIFGWDIDFVLDIRQGDHFHVVFEEFELGGEKLADGNILAAEFTTQGTQYRAIRFANAQGEVSYYNPQGESMLGTFLRSPVEFSRISSRFGRRKHPILKKWRAHRGVDYAASRGTPIRATADGKITLAGKKGGYGNAVVLSHAGRFSTLYGHMSGFAKGIRRNERVKQGDVIGYIGSSGLATGPHLHYEFRVDGVHRNPLTYKTPKASSIDSAQRLEFEQLTSLMATQLDSLSYTYQLAKGPMPPNNTVQTN